MAVLFSGQVPVEQLASSVQEAQAPLTHKLEVVQSELSVQGSANEQTPVSVAQVPTVAVLSAG